jgi:hypothetical protein
MAPASRLQDRFRRRKPGGESWQASWMHSSWFGYEDHLVRGGEVPAKKVGVLPPTMMSTFAADPPVRAAARNGQNISAALRRTNRFDKAVKDLLAPRIETLARTWGTLKIFQRSGVPSD